jgi:D-alanyl-D-alanine carboxypeptidase
MNDTHYDDPSGLSAGNESTPSDLLKLAQKIYTDYPQVLAITRNPEVTITELNTGKNVAVKSINNFAGRPDFIGGKTGYTDEASGNLLSIFRYEDRPVLVIVMGTSDDQRFNNTLALYDWFTANFR